MGIFGSINNKMFGAIYGRKLASMQRGIARGQIRHAKEAVEGQLNFRAQEDPREQAALTQGMWGRGLGKSTIADQDRSRLTMVQDNRNQALRNSLETLEAKRHLLEKSAQINRAKFWSDIGADVLDTVLMGFTGMGGGPSSGTPGSSEGGEGSMMGGMGGM
jgi:hypothetical protein